MKARLLLLISFFIFLFSSNIIKAQEYFGFLHDNWAGVNSIDLNVSTIQDSRFKFDMNLIAFDVNLYNNYVGVRRQLIRDLRNDTYDDQGDFRNTYLIENKNRDNKFLDLGVNIQGPSFMFNIGKKNSLALTSKVRFKTQMTDLTPDLAKLSWEELDYPLLWETKLKNERFSVQSMGWAEYGIGYGREILDLGKHYLKGGIRVKLLQGLAAAYIYADDLNYNFKNSDTLSIFNTDVSYGHSNNLIFNDDNSFEYNFTSKPTVGFDFGFTYEWRKKDASEYTYDMDGQTGLYRRDKNKYKLKVGFAVNDIGRLKFEKDPRSASFNADIRDWDITDLGIDGIESFDQLIIDTYGQDVNDDGVFKMQLPTTVVINIDYNIWKGFYMNFTPYIAMQRRADADKISNHTIFMLSPRFEHKWVGVGMPYTYNTFGSGTHQLGFHLRLGPLFVGTNDFLALGFKKEMYAANVYAGLKIPIPHGKPRDKDKDLVSNKKDKCKKVPGTWENRGCPDSDGDGLADHEDDCPHTAGPIENNGCPYADIDGDGIPDKDDACPEEAGPAENNGCPWGDKDGDGVLDNVDKCPEIAGPAENDGCPWGDKDGDGVLDNVDKCPEVAGSVENDGCPWGDMDGDGVLDKDDACPEIAGPAGNNGCPWGDMDGDGVLDNVDECPKTPGTPENNGCPELEKEEQEILQKAFDNLEFESGKAVIKYSSFVDLDKIVDIMKSRPEAKLKIEGHTDSVGSEVLNLKLSKERALAVKNRLMEKGMAEDRFDVNWYGETRPIADNINAAGRKANRRVEMEIIFE